MDRESKAQPAGGLSPLGGGPAGFGAPALLARLARRGLGAGLTLEELMDSPCRRGLAQPELELGELRAGLDLLACRGIHFEAPGVEHLEHGSSFTLLEPLLEPLLAPLGHIP